MKPIEPGCLTIYVGTKCPELDNVPAALGLQFRPWRRHSKADCGHWYWTGRDAQDWPHTIVECSLIRIDDYDGETERDETLERETA